MTQAQLSTADIPRLLEQLRGMVQSKLRRPVDADLDFLTTQIELASMTHALDLADEHGGEWADYDLSETEAAFATILKSKFGKSVLLYEIMDFLYPGEIEQPAEKIVSVWACKVNKALASSPYAIENVWGKGYRMVARTPSHSVSQRVEKIEWRDGIVLGERQARIAEILWQAKGKWVRGPQIQQKCPSSLIKCLRKNLVGTCYTIQTENGFGYRMVRKST